MSQDGVSRRHFFFGSLLAGAVPLAGYGSVPSLRALGYKPFYDKLNVASIGCGGQGGVDLNDAARTENIVALCDVDEARAEANFKKFDKQPKYKDFRVMLEKEGKNIDAVTIGIPDFMHATVALACMQHGKHVYLEKPLTRTPWEARLLMEAAAKYKVATQMGNQGFSHECNRVAAEIVWSGAIGDVTEAHISTTPGTHPTGMQAQPPESAVPGTLDWQAWLGGAAMRPYSPYYTPYNWRGFPGFRHGADRQLGDAHRGSGADGAATGRAHQPGARQRGRGEQHHVSGPGHGAGGLPGARRYAAGEGLLPRWSARHRSGFVPRSGNGKRDDPAAGEQSGRQGPSDGRTRRWRRGAARGRGAAPAPRPRRRAADHGRERAVRECRCSASRWVRRSPAC